MHLDEGAGTVLLTRRQVRWLRGILDLHDLRGSVKLAVADGNAVRRLPGGPIRLQLGADTVGIPSDPGAAKSPVDPGPITFLLVAGQCVTLLFPSNGAVPLAVVGVMIAVVLAGGWWSHRRLVRRGLDARPSILAVAVAASLALTIIGNPRVTIPVTPDGNTSYMGIGLLLLAYAGGIYWHGLERRLLVLLGAGVLANAALVPLVSPADVHPRSLALSILLSLAPFPTTRRISNSLARATERDAGQSREEDRTERVRAFEEGRETVVGLVRRARDDARRQLANLEITLEPSVASVVQSRLEEVDRRLGSMTEPAVLSSSTTTS